MGTIYPILFLHTRTCASALSILLSSLRLLSLLSSNHLPQHHVLAPSSTIIYVLSHGLTRTPATEMSGVWWSRYYLPSLAWSVSLTRAAVRSLVFVSRQGLVKSTGICGGSSRIVADLPSRQERGRRCGGLSRVLIVGCARMSDSYRYHSYANHYEVIQYTPRQSRA